MRFVDKVHICWQIASWHFACDKFGVDKLRVDISRVDKSHRSQNKNRYLLILNSIEGLQLFYHLIKIKLELSNSESDHDWVFFFPRNDSPSFKNSLNAFNKSKVKSRMVVNLLDGHLLKRMFGYSCPVLPNEWSGE